MYFSVSISSWSSDLAPKLVDCDLLQRRTLTSITYAERSMAKLCWGSAGCNATPQPCVLARVHCSASLYLAVDGAAAAAKAGEKRWSTLRC